MGGKVSIILVMSFSLLFALFGRNILNNSVTITENFSDYYSITRAQSIAISGANMAINKLYLNKSWMAGYSNLPFADGEINVDIDTVGWDSRRITSFGEYNGVTKKVEILLNQKTLQCLETFIMFLVVYGQQLVIHFRADFTQTTGLTVMVILYLWVLLQHQKE